MNTKRAMLAMLAPTLVFAVVAGGCGDDSTGAAIAKAEATRAPVTDAARQQATTLAGENAAYAWKLFHALAGNEGNLFVSPFSISEALAMVYAGARGETAVEMEGVFGFAALKEQTHPAFNALEQALAKPADQAKGAFRLSIANAVWAQKGHPFEQQYLEVLAVNYGSGVRLADFANEPESARKAVNDWASDQTEKRIRELLPSGSVMPETRMVLANAIYFKADWASTFDPESTKKGPFRLPNGGSVEADMMTQNHRFLYVRSGDVEAVELPYEGGRIAMVIILPAEGRFDAFQAALDGKGVAGLLASLEDTDVALTMPRFSFTSEFSLRDALRELGLKTAFEPGIADFSGMDGTRQLFIQGVFHKAFVKVDEKGTEAAAATGVTVGATAMPQSPVTMVVDRPFLFIIRDRETGAVLFAGRVVDPSK